MWGGPDARVGKDYFREVSACVGSHVAATTIEDFKNMETHAHHAGLGSVCERDAMDRW